MPDVLESPVPHNNHDFEVLTPWLRAHLEPLLEWVLQFLRTRSTVLCSSSAVLWWFISLDPSCHLWLEHLYSKGTATPLPVWPAYVFFLGGVLNFKTEIPLRQTSRFGNVQKRRPYSNKFNDYRLLYTTGEDGWPNRRQIIKYGRAKHAWMGLYLNMDQWTERLSRSLEKQGMGKINGVLVPWHKPSNRLRAKPGLLVQSEPDSFVTVGHSLWIELVFHSLTVFWPYISWSVDSGRMLFALCFFHGCPATLCDRKNGPPQFSRCWMWSLTVLPTLLA